MVGHTRKWVKIPLSANFDIKFPKQLHSYIIHTHTHREIYKQQQPNNKFGTMALNVTSDIFLIDILDIWYITRVCLLFSFCCFVWLFAWLLNKRGNYRVSPILDNDKWIAKNWRSQSLYGTRCHQNCGKYPKKCHQARKYDSPSCCSSVVCIFASRTMSRNSIFISWSTADSILPTFLIFFCESKQFYVVFRPLYTQKNIIAASASLFVRCCTRKVHTHTHTRTRFTFMNKPFLWCYPR